MRPEEPVSRIMTEAVVVVELDRPVSEALDCFSQYQIHHLPVVRQGQVAGMLSSADIRKLEHFVPKAADRAKFLDERMTIEQLMHTPVISLGPHASVADAAERMAEAGVHAVPVVDDADRVIGIVTTSDVIRGLLYGPPRKGPAAPPHDAHVSARSAGDVEQVHYHQRPTPDERTAAMSTAEALHVEARDPRFLGKTMLYLAERNAFLEKVLDLADRFLRSGQDVHVHALLLKAVLAAKSAEEHATGQARVPFVLE